MVGLGILLYTGKLDFLLLPPPQRASFVVLSRSSASLLASHVLLPVSLCAHLACSTRVCPYQDFNRADEANYWSGHTALLGLTKAERPRMTLHQFFSCLRLSFHLQPSTRTSKSCCSIIAGPRNPPLHGNLMLTEACCSHRTKGGAGAHPSTTHEIRNTNCDTRGVAQECGQPGHMSVIEQTDRPLADRDYHHNRQAYLAFSAHSPGGCREAPRRRIHCCGLLQSISLTQLRFA